MSLSIRINTAPLLRLAERFTSSEARRIGIARAGIEHVRLTKEIFARRGQPLANWPNKAVPAAPPKGAKRRAMDPTPRLQSTGALVQSITYVANEDGYDIGPGDFVYARVHQFGATIPVSDGMRRVLRGLGFRPRRSLTAIKIPARPYIGLADEWRPIILEAYLSARLDKALEGEGGG